MARGRLLLVFCCIGVSAATSGLRVSCVTDNWRNISCEVNVDDDPKVKFNDYSVNLKDKNGNTFSCPLVAVGDRYHSDCQVKNETPFFSAFEEYNIKLCNETTCQDLDKNFSPMHHVKLTPPPELELQQTSESINITCKSERYQSHAYIRDSLDFELSLRDSTSRQVRTFQLHSKKNHLFIDRRFQLKPNTKYCIKARFKPDKTTFYEATWSEWSEPIYWKNEDTSEPENIVFVLLIYLSPVCVLAGAFLIIFQSPAARLKIKTLSHTPTPAPFFQLLFQKYEGNFQDWLSPEGKIAVTYNMENDLIAEAVTVVPKPITKDPEETQAFLNTSVPHLIFPLGQTSYVGVPEINEAPLTLAAVCPEDIPYTQLPHSVWGFNISDVEVVIPSAPTFGFLEVSQSDSGCSCENLTQSPDSSSPSSPVEDSSPPHYSKDYCILNKTAEGIVPVLLSKESNRNVPSNPQKAEK